MINHHPDILEAHPNDAQEIAALYLAARPEAMPELLLSLTDQEISAWFLRSVSAVPGAWWVARSNGRIVGYMVLQDEDVGHLYVLPEWQGCGVGSALLDKAKALSPKRLTLFAFPRNMQARRFYEARQFRRVGPSDGASQDNAPGVEYVWGAAS